MNGIHNNLKAIHPIRRILVGNMVCSSSPK